MTNGTFYTIAARPEIWQAVLDYLKSSDPPPPKVVKAFLNEIEETIDEQRS